MLDSLVLKKITSYLDLIRFNKPIGFLLLMWPCWFSLSLLKLEINLLLSWLLIFLMGSFFMRSAGCIINDIVDKEIDKNVYRTALRPLASGNISLTEASILLFILLFLSLLILLQFKFFTMIIGLLSIPFVILYPFAKRFTHFPQIILGLIFSWGILIVAYEFNQKINLNHIVLYVACVFWTIGYDTIYAYQDKVDDIKNSIKSTAVFFDQNGKFFVFICYFIVISAFSYLGWSSSKSIFSLIIMAIIGFCTYIAIRKWDMDSIKSSAFYFRQNNIFAIMLFVYLSIF
ncbi:MAG: 4-hydroxybenzoate octaprenyltransferase [Alphaproteobacteria bacterium]